jgi:hypothetical protein
MNRAHAIKQRASQIHFGLRQIKGRDAIAASLRPLSRREQCHLVSRQPIFMPFDAGGAPVPRKTKPRYCVRVNIECGMHVYEVRPRRDKRGVDLISDALPFGRLWYSGPDAISNAIGYAKFYSRSHAMAIRVLDVSGALIETHESQGAFREF